MNRPTKAAESGPDKVRTTSAQDSGRGTARGGDDARMAEHGECATGEDEAASVGAEEEEMMGVRGYGPTSIP